MPKVTFGYDIHKDAWSWVLIAQDKDCWGLDWKNQVMHIPHDLLQQIEKKSESKAIQLVKSHLGNNKYRNFKNEIIKTEIQATERSWKFVEDKYFSILHSITKKPIYQKAFPAYFTTGFMCPYNTDEKPHWFMISVWRSLPDSITTIAHEIFHLQFINYWKETVKKKLGEEKFEDLKEALTFLLNENEFDNIILSEDKGYPNHQKLRGQFSKLWRKNRNFQELINTGIKMLS